MINLALFEPEIPQNVGSLMRLCACFDMTLLIIEPTGFLWNEKKLKRSHMDYFPKVKRYLSFEAFLKEQQIVYLIDKQGKTALWSANFQQNSTFLLGKESTGVTQQIYNQLYENSIYIPMNAKFRSLNLAISAAICVGEAFSQLKF